MIDLNQKTTNEVPYWVTRTSTGEAFLLRIDEI